MEKQRHMDIRNKKHELALIQISIGLAGDKQMEKWLDLELTVKKTKRHLANLLGMTASHVEIVTSTQKGQDTDLLRDALGETRELTLVIMQESDSDSDCPPPLVSASSDEEVRPAGHCGAEVISESPG